VSLPSRLGSDAVDDICLSKAFTNSLLRELVDTPVRVSEVQPGLVETEFSLYDLHPLHVTFYSHYRRSVFSSVRFRGDQAKAKKVYEGVQPLVAEDIAEEIVWIASRPPHVNVAELFVM
jgi:3-hydroxy acid dehydrogenase/malonic semialdehyde reductase